MAAILLCIASSAHAKGQKSPKIFGELKPKVGAWAEYEFETTKKGKTSEKGTYRSAVVAKDEGGTWIEQRFSITEPKPKRDEEQGGIMKMLIGKDGKAKRMLMKTSEGVMDMTRMMKMGGKESEPVEFVSAGKETVSTPAGDFKAEKRTGEGVEMWIKEGVGPYGVVKQVSTEGKEVSTMVLKSYGKDAKAEVEVPAEDEAGAGMMPPGMPDIGAMMRQASERKGKKRKGDDEDDE